MIRKNYLSRSITNHSFFRLFEKSGHYFMTWYGALSVYHNSCLLHFLYEIVFVYVSSMMRVMVTYFLLSWLTYDDREGLSKLFVNNNLFTARRLRIPIHYPAFTANEISHSRLFMQINRLIIRCRTGMNITLSSIQEYPMLISIHFIKRWIYSFVFIDSKIPMLHWSQ